MDPVLARCITTTTTYRVSAKGFRISTSNTSASEETASNASISEQVLRNPELLENILIHLSQRDLLVNAPRVSRLLKSIIDASPTLQQELYFQPMNQKEGPVGNPLLLWAFNPILKQLWSCTCNGRRWPSISIWRGHFRHSKWNKSPTRREAYRRKDASKLISS